MEQRLIQLTTKICEQNAEIQQIKSQLRTLAQAVLEAHNKPTEFGPWAGNDDGESCPCPACTLAREVLK